MKKIILTITSALIIVSCKEHNTQIAIINKSKIKIFFNSSEPQKDKNCKCFSCCGINKLYENDPSFDGRDFATHLLFE